METLKEIGLIAILMIANWYLAQVVIYFCAKNNKLWSIIKEGHAIAVMHNGVFNKMIMRFTGHAFTDEMSEGKDNLEIYDIKPVPVDNTKTKSDTLLKFIFPVKGVAWIGLPPWSAIYHEKIFWTDDRFEKREEDISQFLVQKYVYGITLPKLELKGGIPYNARFLVTLYFTNPAKAYFRVKRVIETSMERITGWTRTEMSALSIDDFIAPTAGKNSQPQIQPSDELEEAIKRIINKINSELSPEFGVGSSSFVVHEIDPSDEKMRGVIVAKEIAKNEGEAELIRAELKAKALTAVNKAASEMSDKGMQLEAYDAIKNAKANVTLVGPNVNALISVGSQAPAQQSAPTANATT